MFLTRIGENSKLVVNGDPSQVDLLNKNSSGLTNSTEILKKLKHQQELQFFHQKCQSGRLDLMSIEFLTSNIGLK